jgi:hypothetical protein
VCSVCVRGVLQILVSYFSEILHTHKRLLVLCFLGIEAGFIRVFFLFFFLSVEAGCFLLFGDLRLISVRGAKIERRHSLSRPSDLSTPHRDKTIRIILHTIPSVATYNLQILARLIAKDDTLRYWLLVPIC